MPDEARRPSKRRLAWTSLEHDASEVLETVLGMRRFVWSPDNHWLLPKCIREGVFAIFLCHQLRPESAPGMLPLEVLFVLFTEYVKSTSAFLCHEVPTAQREH